MFCHVFAAGSTVVVSSLGSNIEMGKYTKIREKSRFLKGKPQRPQRRAERKRARGRFEGRTNAAVAEDARRARRKNRDERGHDEKSS